MALEKGTFVVSIDHEFAWGYADYNLNESDKERIRNEVGIINRLISLFETYNTPATWALVGHLIDRGCPWNEEGIPHPDYPRSIYIDEEYNWFSDHPPKDEYTDTLWFDTENLAGKIRNSSAGHDIASHSYAHILYDEKRTKEDAVRADLKNLGRVHRVHDVPLTSFIFPRNVEGYHRHLKVNGFTNYRGNSKKWYDGLPNILKRVARLIDYYIPTGRTVDPCHTRHGLVDVPDSMLLLGRNGLRKVVTKGTLFNKAKRGIDKAAKKGEVFHLWFHPSNFSYSTDEQFEIFERILKYAHTMREKGKLDVTTMEKVAEKCIKNASNNS